MPDPDPTGALQLRGRITRLDLPGRRLRGSNPGLHRQLRRRRTHHRHPHIHRLTSRVRGRQHITTATQNHLIAQQVQPQNPVGLEPQPARIQVAANLPPDHGHTGRPTHRVDTRGDLDIHHRPRTGHTGQTRLPGVRRSQDHLALAIRHRERRSPSGHRPGPTNIRSTPRIADRTTKPILGHHIRRRRNHHRHLMRHRTRRVVIIGDRQLHHIRPRLRVRMRNRFARTRPAITEVPGIRRHLAIRIGRITPIERHRQPIHLRTKRRHRRHIRHGHRHRVCRRDGFPPVVGYRELDLVIATGRIGVRHRPSGAGRLIAEVPLVEHDLPVRVSGRARVERHVEQVGRRRERRGRRDVRRARGHLRAVGARSSPVVGDHEGHGVDPRRGVVVGERLPGPLQAITEVPGIAHDGAVGVGRPARIERRRQVGDRAVECRRRQIVRHTALAQGVVLVHLPGRQRLAVDRDLVQCASPPRVALPRGVAGDSPVAGVRISSRHAVRRDQDTVEVQPHAFGRLRAHDVVPLVVIVRGRGRENLLRAGPDAELHLTVRPHVYVTVVVAARTGSVRAEAHQLSTTGGVGPEPGFHGVGGRRGIRPVARGVSRLPSTADPVRGEGRRGVEHPGECTRRTQGDPGAAGVGAGGAVLTGVFRLRTRGLAQSPVEHRIQIVDRSAIAVGRCRRDRGRPSRRDPVVVDLVTSQHPVVDGHVGNRTAQELRTANVRPRAQRVAADPPVT